MSKLFWFPTPLDSHCEFIHDSDAVVRVGKSDTHPTGRLGQSFDVSGLPNRHGGRLTTSHPSHSDVVLRGVLDLTYFSNDLAALLVDDVALPT